MKRRLVLATLALAALGAGALSGVAAGSPTAANHVLCVMGPTPAAPQQEGLCVWWSAPVAPPQ